MSAKDRRKWIAERNKKLGPLKKELTVIENRIAVIEKEHSALEKAMADPAFFKQGNETKVSVDRYNELKMQIQAAYERWEMLNEKITAF